MTNDTKHIIQELKGIRQDLEYIKSHVIDIDLVLTDDDIESIRTAEEDLKKRKTKK